MNNIVWIQGNDLNQVCIVVTIFLASIDFFAFLDFNVVYAVQLFSKNEKPFGVSYDDWVAKYWNWDV